MYSKQINLNLFILLLTSITFQSFGQGVSVDNGRLFFNKYPGERDVKEIVLSNPTNQKVIFQMIFQDWVRDTFGNKLYERPGTLKHSCSTWASVDQNTIELPPMSEKTLSVSLTPPADVDPEVGVYNAMLFIRQIKDPYSRKTTKGHLRSSFNTTFQIGIHLYYIHPSLKQQELAIKGFELEDKKEENDRKFLVKLENIGETLVDGHIKLELTNRVSGKEYRLYDNHPVSAAFMPKDIRYVSLEIPDDIPEGEYSALAIVDIGAAHDLQMAVIDVKIPKK